MSSLSHQLIVYALGHQYDNADPQQGATTAMDHAISSITSLLDESDKARTNQAIVLCRRYGRILSWCRRQQTNWAVRAPAALQVFASRIEEILLGHLIIAGRQEGLSEIYAAMWEPSVLLDLADQCLVEKQDLNALLFHLQQEIFPDARILHQDWLHLQLQLWTRWIVFGCVPSNSIDFWIQHELDDADPAHPGSTATPVWNAFTIEESKLPPLMPAVLAEKVLFLGKAVRVLSDANMIDDAREQWLCERVFDIFGSPYPARPGANIAPPVLYWNSLEVTVKVDAILQEIVQSLHALLAKEHKLSVHIQLLRDYLLMQNGYFYHLFIQRTEALMHAKPTMNSERDVNHIFRDIGAEVIDDDAIQSLFNRFQLSFSAEPRKPRGSSVLEVAKGYDKWFWGDLHLHYDVSGPLGLILSPPILKLYDSVFQFLFSVVRIQAGLNRLWTAHRKRDEIPKIAWLIRAKMSHFIDHLAAYLRGDVIAYHSGRLQERMNSSQTLDELKRAHDDFIQEVAGQSFVHAPPVKRALRDIVDICDAFCKAIHEMIYEGSVDTELIMSMEKDFARKTKFAFILLSGVKGQALHLAKLLLMLDFNEYYSGGIEDDEDD